MAISTVYKVAGQTFALSVVATQHAAVAITSNTNEVCSFASFQNSSTTLAVCIAVGPLSSTGAAQSPGTLVLPVDGTPSGIQSFMLPPNSDPIIIAVPNSNSGFSVTAIATGAGPSLVYITPVIPQS